jgi:hypothetical protein
MDRSFFLVCVFASTLTLTVSPGALAQGELATLVPASLVALLLTGTAYVCGEGGGAGQHAQMRPGSPEYILETIAAQSGPSWRLLLYSMLIYRG